MPFSWETVLGAVIGAVIALIVAGLVRLLIQLAVSWLDKPIRLDAELRAEEFMDLRWQERIKGMPDDPTHPVRRILRAIHDVQARQVKCVMIKEARTATRWPISKLRYYLLWRRRMQGVCIKGCGRPAARSDDPSQSRDVCRECLKGVSEPAHARFPAELLPLPRTWEEEDMGEIL